MKEKVSIIMGIYNCEETLAEAIESIINQTYKNWELIMCDDASKDKTYKIAKKYKRRYPDKIKLLKNEKNMKLSYTLNKCLEISSGKYIARMDGDDISHHNRLEKQVKFLNANHEFSLVGSGVTSFNSKGIRGERIREGEVKKNELYLGKGFAHPTIMIYKKIIDELKGYTVSKRTRRGQDIDLWIKFFSKGYRGFNLGVSLYSYREEEEEIIKKRNFDQAKGVSQTLLLGVKKLGLPYPYYFLSLKPVISAILPSKFMYLYHNLRLR